MRERSSWDRKTLSYCGRKRTGAGQVGVGDHAVLDVEQLAARLVAVVPGAAARRRSTTSRRPVIHDHVRMSAALAGPNARR